jgi:hypothetical protein
MAITPPTPLLAYPTYPSATCLPYISLRYLPTLHIPSVLGCLSLWFKGGALIRVLATFSLTGSRH